MNQKRKAKIRSRLEQLEHALHALDEIIPDNLRVLAIWLEKTDSVMAAHVSPDLKRWADLLDELHNPEPVAETPWTPFEQVAFSPDPNVHAQMCEATQTDEVWRNSRYQVNIRWLFPKVHTSADGACTGCGLTTAQRQQPDGEYCKDPTRTMIHVSCKRHDKAAIHDWRELQRIKTELIGPDFEAIEIYPAESRHVDTSNQYHLWVLPKGETAGVGYGSRLILETEDFGVRQRPFTDPDLKAEAARNQELLQSGKIDGADALNTYMALRPNV